MLTESVSRDLARGSRGDGQEAVKRSDTSREKARQAAIYRVR